MKPYKYSGVLGKERESVIPLGYWRYPDEEEWQAKAAAAVQAQQEALIDALFANCGISQSDPFGWREVALTLARRHVKAFQKATSGQRGRPHRAAQDLVDEVMEVVGRRNLSIRSASVIVAKRRGGGISGRTVESRVHTTMKAGRKAKKQLDLMIEKMRQK
jgi:hypothetical protein